MRRRDFIAIVGGAATVWPFGAQAQQEPRAPRVPRVGFVGLASPAVDDPAILPFRQALKGLGYTEGRNIILEIPIFPSSRSRCRPRKASPGCFQVWPIPAAA